MKKDDRIKQLVMKKINEDLSEDSYQSDYNCKVK